MSCFYGSPSHSRNILVEQSSKWFHYGCFLSTRLEVLGAVKLVESIDHRAGSGRDSQIVACCRGPGPTVCRVFGVGPLDTFIELPALHTVSTIAISLEIVHNRRPASGFGSTFEPLITTARLRSIHRYRTRYRTVGTARGAVETVCVIRGRARAIMVDVMGTPTQSHGVPASPSAEIGSRHDWRSIRSHLN